MEVLNGLQSFLLFTMGTFGVGLGSIMTNDFLKTERGKKLLRRLKMQKVSHIPFDQEHTTVLGTTQHGKTYAVLNSLPYCTEGVLFFNVQDTGGVPSEFVKADKNISIDQLLNALKKGKKINYVPSTDTDQMSKELGALIDELYQFGKFKCKIAIDEVHLFSMIKDKSALNACRKLAITGLGRGYSSIFVAQRPAGVDNTIYTQSTKLVSFALGKNDYKYLHDHGFPSDDMAHVTQNKKYLFSIYNQKTVEGPFMIGK